MDTTPDPDADNLAKQSHGPFSWPFLAAWVLLILGAFLVIIVPNVNVRTVHYRWESARVQIPGFSTALSGFQMLCGRYPTTAEGLPALVARPANLPEERWDRQIDSVPLDPWGHPYVYVCPGIHNPNTYDLYSLGRDGVTQTNGSDPDDINNWDARSPYKRK